MSKLTPEKKEKVWFIFSVVVEGFKALFALIRRRRAERKAEREAEKVKDDSQS